jgi:hypothetical protein
MITPLCVVAVTRSSAGIAAGSYVRLAAEASAAGHEAHAFFRDRYESLDDLSARRPAHASSGTVACRPNSSATSSPYY